jgi:serine/threonine-protein kinase
METKSFGSCRVTELVASGQVTDVYRGIQHPLGRLVAIKALKPEIAPSSPFALGLQREASILSTLGHDNIARLFHYSHTDDSMWLVLELVDGFSLRHLLTNLKSLDVAAATAIAIEVVRALAHAHERGIIHCDVRPSNILVGKDGRVVLIDFGSAYAESMPLIPEPLDVDVAVEAPSHMSPEQILGETLDPRCDIFAMGVVLYELLSHRRPFESKEGRSLAHSVRHDEPISLGRNIPRGLAQIVARCLQKLPNDRFASARELCASLEDVYNNLSSQPRRHVITSMLTRARLVDRPILSQDRPDRLAPTHQRPSLLPALRMLLVLLVLMVAGIVVIHWIFRSDMEARVGSGQGPLLLAPEHAGSLLVLAQPWAHVVVDGQMVETTPFSRPIPLSPGIHHITLRHPHAPDERRTVRVAPGERVVLDVTMQVKRPLKPVVSAEPVPAPSSSTP